MARLAASGLLVGLSLTVLGLAFMDSVSARGSVRMRLRRTYPAMTVKFGAKSKFGVPAPHDDWNIALPSLLRLTEAKARAADKRLMKITPNLHAQLIGSAVSRGPVRKVVSMYKRYRPQASCGGFEKDAEKLSLVAERHYQRHLLQDSNRMYSSAMNRFQRGLDCYATRFVGVLLGRSAFPGLGLEDLSSGMLDRPILEHYKQAAWHNARLRHQAAFAWQTAVRLDKAVSFIFALTDYEDETLSDAIARALVEMDARVKSDTMSSMEQAQELLREDSESRPEDSSTPEGEFDLHQKEDANIMESAQELMSGLGFDFPPQEMAEEEEERVSNVFDPASLLAEADSSSRRLTPEETTHDEEQESTNTSAPAQMAEDGDELSSDTSPLPEANSPPTRRLTTAPAEKTQDEESDLPPLPSGESPLLALLKTIEEGSKGGES